MREMPEIREKVRRGAELLDKILPDWYKAVDLKKLRMEDGSLCLLGQTFGRNVEKSLAKEMYPELFTELRKTGSWPGYSMGLRMIPRIIAKRFRGKEKVTAEKEFRALNVACCGYDTRCEWAEEVAERRAKDGGSAKG